MSDIGLHHSIVVVIIIVLTVQRREEAVDGIRLGRLVFSARPFFVLLESTGVSESGGGASRKAIVKGGNIVAQSRHLSEQIVSLVPGTDLEQGCLASAIRMY